MRHRVKKYDHQLKSCGQFSIAMATGFEPEAVAAELGWGALTVRQITNYLVRHGYSDGTVGGVSHRTSFEGVGILIIASKREGHAVAFCDGAFYDPNGAVFTGYEALRANYEEDGEQWHMASVIRAAPVKTREWAVGE